MVPFGRQAFSESGPLFNPPRHQRKEKETKKKNRSIIKVCLENLSLSLYTIISCIFAQPGWHRSSSKEKMDSSLKFIGLWFSIIRVYGFIGLQWLQPFPLWWNIVCTESIKFTRQDSNSGAAAICRGKSFERLAFRKAGLLWHKELLYWWSPLLPVHWAIAYQARLYISGWHWWELFSPHLQIFQL